MHELYDATFFDEVERTARASALRVVPVAVRAWRPRHVVDVGCGEGVWAAAFEALGVPALGIDGSHVVPQRRLVGRFLAHELTAPLPALGRFDLCLCLEVAEHLPASAADGLVASLAALADRVLFSAAVPGQGGTGHVNEQPHAYWIERFARHGFVADETWRDRFADDEDVAWWYRQNLLVLERREPRRDEPPRLADRATAPAPPAAPAAPLDLGPHRRRVAAHLHSAAPLADVAAVPATGGRPTALLARVAARALRPFLSRQAAWNAEVVGALHALDEGLALLAAEVADLRREVGDDGGDAIGARLRRAEYALRRLHGPLLAARRAAAGASDMSASSEKP